MTKPILSLLFAALCTGLLRAAEPQKTFPPREDVVCRPVRYRNRLGILLAGDLYLPKALDRTRRHAAVIVGHPYGGVKEQCAGLYAQELAARGFVALAFDLSYAGESGGRPSPPRPTPRTSRPRWISSGCSPSWTVGASGRWASAAAGASR